MRSFLHKVFFIYICCVGVFGAGNSCKPQKEKAGVEKLYAQFVNSDVVISSDLVYMGAKSSISRVDVLKNGKVWLVGSPVENEKVRRVYEEALKTI